MMCSDCGREIDHDEVRYAFDEPYCEVCFSERFSTCERCDAVMERDEIFVEEDEILCERCYEDQNDMDAPENPYVDDQDRELVISLSRKWLFSKQTKTVISINPNDQYLKEIRQRAGEIDHPVYVYGLMDREEYQIKASKDIHSRVIELQSTLGLDSIVYMDDGKARLGISYDLRQARQGKIVELIKEVSKCAE